MKILAPDLKGPQMHMVEEKLTWSHGNESMVVYLLLTGFEIKC